MENKKYYTRLSFIRVMACIMVLLYHLKIIKGGFLAVCTFFTLSGYLECISSLKNDNFSITKYYIKRIKKIYIPLLIVISLTLIFYKQVSFINWLNLKQESISAVFGYNNFWQLNANLDYFTKNINSPFVHLWYISILMQFDLVFPIIFSILKKIDKKINKHISTIVFLILSIVSLAFFINMSMTHDIMSVYYNTFARSFSLIWGIFLGIIHYKYKIRLSNAFKNYDKIIFIIYSLILCIICIFLPGGKNYYALYMILVTMISCRLIEYSLVKSKNKGLINSLARISYEIYLVQYPVIFFVQNMNINSSYKIPLMILLIFIISILIHNILNLSFKNKMIMFIKTICLSTIVIVGALIIIKEKDHKKEMENLEKKLNENLKIMEQKNLEYMNKEKEADEKFEQTLESMDTEVSEVVKEELKKISIVGIGDSVFLDAVDMLYNYFPNGYFNGKISRSIIGGINVLKDLKDSGKLSDIVLLGLASNGDYSNKKATELMNLLGNREVYWINAVGADDPTYNEKFKNFAKNYPNIHIVDWEAASKGHPEYFYADGTHPKGNGIKIYVNTIYNTIYNDYLEKHKDKKNELIQNKEQEEKEKVAFYGNDLLTNSYEYLKDKFEHASYNAESNYKFNDLYKDIENKIQNNALEYKIVFVYDKDAKITNEQYLKLKELCSNHKIYIVNVTDTDLTSLGSDVEIINFYNEIKKNSDYLMADKIHLSKKGNKELANLIFNTINSN